MEKNYTHQIEVLRLAQNVLKTTAKKNCLSYHYKLAQLEYLGELIAHADREKRAECKYSSSGFFFLFFFFKALTLFPPSLAESTVAPNEPNDQQSGFALTRLTNGSKFYILLLKPIKVESHSGCQSSQSSQPSSGIIATFC